MNRAEKRKLARAAQKRGGLTRDQAKIYAEIASKADEIRRRGAGAVTASKEFDEGEKVMINVPAIKARQNYELMAPSYKQFIEDSGGKEFTAHIEENKLISLVEEPQWLFWGGDLLHLNEVEPEADNESNNQS